MTLLKLNQKIITCAILSIIIFFSACNNKSEKEKKIVQPVREIDTSNVLIKFNNTLFTLPSPYQATYSIKKSNLSFNKIQ